MLVVGEGAQYVYLIGILILAMFLFGILRGETSSQHRMAVAAAILLAFIIVFICTVTRYTDAGRVRFYLETPYMQRYIYLSKMIFAFLLLSQIVTRIRAMIPKLRLPAQTVLLASCACYLLAVNIDNSFLYQSSPTEGRRVADFLSNVRQDIKRAQLGESYVPEHVLDRGGTGRWDIRLNIDQHLGRKGSSNKSP